ncbi:cytochrome c biogenesis CcdA family protein [Nocardioides currus]|uniref:Cytochrome C biogenesis protein ResC n=1 Tax=Nocardioides currus TaxID=2133958 RepID=A0A2R7YWJ4_9ACTN|nr:cytochrome c biogenesis protein CcdA [Nocardioides currus]PUA80777.1 cytochrome C biogenesis protein ResC [Nocardioides currus]
MPVPQLVGNLQEAVLSGPLVLALVVAAVAGLVSFFSPCCLPLVPVYLGYVSGLADGRDVKGGPVSGYRPQGAGRVVAGTVLFVLGFSTVFTAYGAAFGQLGRALVSHQELLIRVSGAITLLMGLAFLGAFARITALSGTYRPRVSPRIGLAGAPVLGGLFAIGWTPCIGPTLAAVLTLSTTAATAERGALLTFVYSLGLGLPFLVAAFSFGRAGRTFGWVRAHLVLVTRAGGIFLVLIGLAQLLGIWSVATAELQGLISGWRAPL